MVKLALAIGFMAVFGYLTYFLSVRLFLDNKKEEEALKSKNKPHTNKKK